MVNLFLIQTHTFGKEWRHYRHNSFFLAGSKACMLLIVVCLGFQEEPLGIDQNTLIWIKEKDNTWANVQLGII